MIISAAKLTKNIGSSTLCIVTLDKTSPTLYSVTKFINKIHKFIFQIEIILKLFHVQLFKYLMKIKLRLILEIVDI